MTSHSFLWYVITHPCPKSNSISAKQPQKLKHGWIITYPSFMWTLSLTNAGLATQIAKFMGPTWGPPGSCRPQMGPMLAPWTLLSGYNISVSKRCPEVWSSSKWITTLYSTSQNDPMEYANMGGFVVLWLYSSSRWIHVIHLPIFFRVGSLALGQSYDCPSACEPTLKDMGKTDQCLTTTKPNKEGTICIILAMYCIYVFYKYLCHVPFPTSKGYISQNVWWGLTGSIG